MEEGVVWKEMTRADLALDDRSGNLSLTDSYGQTGVSFVGE